MSVTLLLTGGFALLVICAIPFAISIGLVTLGSVISGDMEPAFLAQQIIAGSQSFSLLAIPLFMLAGEIMTAGKLSQRLVEVASTLVGHRTGGLAIVTVLAATVFAAISGSAPATTAAIGGIMIPAMVKAGYDKAFAASIAVSAGVLGPLIPPSIAFVIWGIVAEQSIGRLFLSGVIPGLSIVVGLIFVCWLHARRNNVPKMAPASWSQVGRAIRDGKWALLSPVFVLGGIYGGVFTPTEAAAMSCVYALVVGVLTGTLDLRQMPELFIRSARTSAMVTSIIAVSVGFGVLVAQERIAVDFAAWMADNLRDKWLALASLNLAFFLLAAVMDEIAIMVVLGPMLIAIATRFGVDPVHFGAIIVTNVAIGMAAPPIGYCLFVGMAISGLSLARISRAIWPQILVMLVVLMLTTYIPEFALLLQPK
ncbi:TRAP transporter large permease [Roseococcus sp.]|uniref:TRAP transporter large permease n=1 Tax=Roseococcus sp. TaxID=2109646 RepID=UPI003BACB053